MATKSAETSDMLMVDAKDTPWVDYSAGNLVAQWDMTMADLTELQRVVM